MNPPKTLKKAIYVADVTLLLPPLLPGGTELHLLLLQRVPVGQTLRLPLTVWEHKNPASASDCSSGRWFIQKRTWYYSKLEKT